MKKTFYHISIVILGIILLLAGCLSVPKANQNPLSSYSEIITGDIPDDICLTIYYVDPQILTTYPWSADTLINSSTVQKIVVEREEILRNIDTFHKLNWSILTPTKNELRINARLYYVIESSEHGKLLEVVISEVRGNVVVNGIEVENNSLFYELIWPYLPEDARVMYDYQKTD